MLLLRVCVCLIDILFGRLLVWLAAVPFVFLCVFFCVFVCLFVLVLVCLSLLLLFGAMVALIGGVVCCYCRWCWLLVAVVC